MRYLEQHWKSLNGINWELPSSHVLLVPQVCIPVELQDPTMFAKWHLNVMQVVRGSLYQTLMCKHTHNQEEACENFDCGLVLRSWTEVILASTRPGEAQLI